jgi:inositol 1,4,5-triphosphate receptor type 1
LNLFLKTGLLEVETARAIFQDNVALCSEVSERVVQHFVRAIASRRHMAYLKFLQTIIKPKGTLIRKCQDMIMTELLNVGEEVLVFFNDRTSFQNLIEMMKNERDRMDPGSLLQYHINLVQLLV